jgi:hypothetical protein
MKFGTGVRFVVRIILPLLAPSAPHIAAENVHFSIDASKPGASIDRNLFGQFAEILGHGLYEGIWVGPDGLRFDATKLHMTFDTYGIANSFEIYSGTYTSALADRFQNHVLPFFSKNLCFRADYR